MAQERGLSLLLHRQLPPLLQQLQQGELQECWMG
jgi:hypothetical protein